MRSWTELQGGSAIDGDAMEGPGPASRGAPGASEGPGSVGIGKEWHTHLGES